MQRLCGIYSQSPSIIPASRMKASQPTEQLKHQIFQLKGSQQASEVSAAQTEFGDFKEPTDHSQGTEGLSYDHFCFIFLFSCILISVSVFALMFTWASQVAQWQRIHLQYRRCSRLGFDPWVRKIRWSRKWQPTPVFLPGKSTDIGVCWATVQGRKESDVTEHTCTTT